jgi:hypothetical protein
MGLHPPELCDLGRQPTLAQSFDHDPALPARVQTIAHVLGLASSADAEVTAYRSCAVVAHGGQHLRATIACNAHPLAGKCERDVADAPGGRRYSIALGPQADDFELDCHGSS